MVIINMIAVSMMALFPLALLAYIPHVGNPEITHGRLICWYTSGFE